MTIDLLTPDALRNPRELFASIRDRGPVTWSEAHKAWLVNDYQSVVDGFRDTETLTSDRLTPLERRLSQERRETLALTFEVLRGWMTFHDAPRHAVLRNPVRRAFTPKRVGDLRQTTTRIVDELLNNLEERVGETVDLKQEFAFPMPAIVIAELLDIPASDRHRFQDWSRKLSAIVFGESENIDQAATAADGSAEFTEYFQWLIRERTEAPGDDLISALIAARGTDDSPGLTDMELVGACTLLLFAGHETTTNLITNSSLALLEYPDQTRALVSDESLLPSAIEELIRHDGPVKIMVRSVSRDHLREGQELRAGDSVFLSVTGANHDPSVFQSPDELDLRRSTKTPHVGFGQGPHFCLGHALARLELGTALPALFKRFPGLELATDHVEWEPLILVRSAADLPVRLNR